MACYLPYGFHVDHDARVDRRDPRPQHLAEALHLRRERKAR
jgi:hypothetical protein